MENNIKRFHSFTEQPRHIVENGIPYTFDPKTQTYLAFGDETETEEVMIGRFGRMREDYLKENYEATYSRLLLTNQLTAHLLCVLIINKNEPTERFLINIDEYIEMEKHIYLSLIGNLEYVVEEYYQLYKALSPTKISGLGDITDICLFEEKTDSDDNTSYKPDSSDDEENDLDRIISDNMKEEENEVFCNEVLRYSQAKIHLFKIEEYLEKLLNMEDEIKRKHKKEKYKI